MNARTPFNPLEVIEERPLSTEAALAWLAERGIQTSRSELDKLRASGDLTYLRTRGKIRIMYRREALARAFIQEEVSECSSSCDQRAGKTGSSAEQLPDSAFTKALAQIQSGSPKRKGTGSRPNSCNGPRLVRPQR